MSVPSVLAAMMFLWSANEISRRVDDVELSRIGEEASSSQAGFDVGLSGIAPYTFGDTTGTTVGYYNDNAAFPLCGFFDVMFVMDKAGLERVYLKDKRAFWEPLSVATVTSTAAAIRHLTAAAIRPLTAAAAAAAAAADAAAQTAAAAAGAGAGAAVDPLPYAPDPIGRPGLVFTPAELLVLRLRPDPAAAEKPEFRIELAASYDTDTKYLVLIVKSRDVLHHKANTSAVAMALAAATERYNDANQDDDFDATFGAYKVLVVVYSDATDLNSAADPVSRDAMFARVSSTFGDRLSGRIGLSLGKTRALDDSGRGSARYLTDEQFRDAWKEYENDKNITKTTGTLLLVGSTLAHAAHRQKHTSDKVFVVDPSDLTDRSDVRGVGVEVRLTPDFVKAHPNLDLGKPGFAHMRAFWPSVGFKVTGGGGGQAAAAVKTKWRPAGELRRGKRRGSGAARRPAESRKAASERRALAVRQAVRLYASRTGRPARRQPSDAITTGSLQLGGYSFAASDPDAHFYRVMFRVRGTEAPDDGPDGLDFFFRLTELEDGTAAPLRLSDDRMWLDLMGDTTGFVKQKYSELLEPGVKTTTQEDDDNETKANSALTAVEGYVKEVEEIGKNIRAYETRLGANLPELVKLYIPPPPPPRVPLTAVIQGASASRPVAASRLAFANSKAELTRIHDLMADAIGSPNAIEDMAERRKRAQALIIEATAAKNKALAAERDFIEAVGEVLQAIVLQEAASRHHVLVKTDAMTAIHAVVTNTPESKYSKEIALAASNKLWPILGGGSSSKATTASPSGGGGAECIDLGAAVYILTAVRSAAVAVGFVDIKNAPRGARWKAARAVLIRDGAFGLAATLLMVAVAGGDPIALSVAFAITWAVMALVVAAFVVADSALADMRRETADRLR